MAAGRTIRTRLDSRAARTTQPLRTPSAWYSTALEPPHWLAQLLLLLALATAMVAVAAAVAALVVVVGFMRGFSPRRW
jgi:hypothetical protein